MKELSFKKEQEFVEETKRQLKDRVTDEAIQEEVDRLRGGKGSPEGGITFKPLVGFAYENNAEMPKYEALAMLKASSFPHKKIVLKEILHDRARVVMKNGGFVFVHD